MLIKDLSETSKNKLLGIGFALDDSINHVPNDGGGHGNVFGFYIDAPIHYAAREGDLDLLTELCDKGADINILSGSNWTAIMLAADYGRKDVVDFLIKKGADITLRAPRTEYRDVDGKMGLEEILIPCEEKGKYPAPAGYDLKDVISEKNSFWPTTFFWTQYQKHALGKQVNYSGTQILIDDELSKLRVGSKN